MSEEGVGLGFREAGRSRLDISLIIKSLIKVAREAAPLYGDEPSDYKGRTVTPELVLGVSRNPHYVDLITETIKYASGTRVLDVGISYGIYDVVLKREFGFQVYGLEHPENVHAYCRFPIKQEIPVIPCDIHFDEIPFRDGVFDVVIASEIVEHLFLSPKAFFSKLYRCLKTGGKIIITTPNFKSIRNIIHLVRGENPSALFPDMVLGDRGRIMDSRVHPREYTLKEVERALVDSGFWISSIYTDLATK